MERLTNKKEADAQRRAYEKRLEQGYPRCIPEERFLRLAAYEDTGLEPEEIKAAFNEEAVLKLAAQALGTTPDRLRELVKVQDEGRVVVLPCKVGDAVYALGYQSIRELTICSCTRIGCCAEDENEKYEYLGNDVFGKTVFLTRAEAEAALGGGGDG